jgi:hypothetical protein
VSTSERVDESMIMNDKQHILTLLRQEFNRWEELLSSLSEEQITDPFCLPTCLSKM